MSEMSIDELAKQIADRVRTTVPIDEALWNVDDIGNYLRRSPETTRERIVCLPEFPKAIRLPTMRGDGTLRNGHPLWRACEVIQWARSYQEKEAPGRPRKVG